MVEFLRRQYGMTQEQAVWQTPAREASMLAKAHSHNHGQRQDWGGADFGIRTLQILERMEKHGG